jgi:hypothetical protein
MLATETVSALVTRLFVSRAMWCLTHRTVNSIVRAQYVITLVARRSVRRTHRALTDGAGLDIGGTADLLTVITGHRVGLTEWFVAYRAIDSMCSTERFFADKTLSKVFSAECIGTFVTRSCMLGAVRRLTR